MLAGVWLLSNLLEESQYEPQILLEQELTSLASSTNLTNVHQ